jgi:hypothetical protein
MNMMNINVSIVTQEAEGFCTNIVIGLRLLGRKEKGENAI